MKCPQFTEAPPRSDVIRDARKRDTWSAAIERIPMNHDQNIVVWERNTRTYKCTLYIRNLFINIRFGRIYRSLEDFHDFRIEQHEF